MAKVSARTIWVGERGQNKAVEIPKGKLGPNEKGNVYSIRKFNIYIYSEREREILTCGGGGGRAGLSEVIAPELCAVIRRQILVGAPPPLHFTIVLRVWLLCLRVKRIYVEYKRRGGFGGGTHSRWVVWLVATDTLECVPFRRSETEKIIWINETSVCVWGGRI